MVRYAKNAGAVFSLKLHLVWCSKYRLPVLVGAVSRRLERLLRDEATALEMTLHALEVMPDHVHMFVEFDPRWAVAEIANRFKGTTSHILRQEFANLRSRMPTLWSRSYYAGTVGYVSESTVRRYIEAQKSR